MLILFGGPAVHSLDPWLCVTKLLWLCPYRRSIIYLFLKYSNKINYLHVLHEWFLINSVGKLSQVEN